MNLSDFNYNLPARFIAQERIHPYEKAKLLVFDRKKSLVEHRHIADLPKVLDKNDVLVFNDSKVIPARIRGIKKTGGQVEILLLKKLSDKTWQAMAKPGKGLKTGNNIAFFNTDLTAKVVKVEDNGQRILELSKSGQELIQTLEEIGEMPIPPYIHTPLTNDNKNDYQTCFAHDLGSVAAPTAGLHFTPELLESLKIIGVQLEFITLHVGFGTFAPINDNDVARKKLHSEYFSLNKETAKRLNMAKQNGKRIIAVGTTTVRVLESCVNKNGFLSSKNRETKIFIQPGDKFKFVDAIMTNFHLPKSSLLMLIAAFAGLKETLELYEIAKGKEYRFFSFGDAMLIL
ncbi:MAG: tRNA preQ1(34) S-adenosylmethionine ribosyltransferase-isomerase QueA [Patescibacteria group bacterium]|nr:tRNA preQ1(34) S-adenosylmethionine ribosyltransferase-isomerase QueA [Patescibacteria group bacterium]